MIINSGDYSPGYFYTIYLIKSKPNAFYSSYRMLQLPQLMISGCYDELLADLSLLQSFFEDKWTSVNELPHMGALCFCTVLEGLFTQLVSLVLWAQTKVRFITSSSRKNNKWGDHPHGDPGHQQSMGGEPGNGDCLLPLWPGKSGAFSCTCDLIPVGLSWARHSGGEDLQQLALYPLGVLQLPLHGHNHPFSWCFNCSISTYPAMPMQVTPVLFHLSHPAMKEGR